MSSWKAPKVVEIPAGMEIGAYAPAEMDGPPRVRAAATAVDLSRASASLGPSDAPAGVAI